MIHVSTNIGCKARQQIGIIFLGFLNRDLYIMRLAFVTYLQPIFAYNSDVWKSLFKLPDRLNRKRSATLASVSRHCQHIPYPERLTPLDLDPLELQRLEFELTYYF